MRPDLIVDGLLAPEESEYIMNTEQLNKLRAAFEEIGGRSIEMTDVPDWFRENYLED